METRPKVYHVIDLEAGDEYAEALLPQVLEDIKRARAEGYEIWVTASCTSGGENGVSGVHTSPRAIARATTKYKSLIPAELVDTMLIKSGFNTFSPARCSSACAYLKRRNPSLMAFAGVYSTLCMFESLYGAHVVQQGRTELRMLMDRTNGGLYRAHLHKLATRAPAARLTKADAFFAEGAGNGPAPAEIVVPERDPHNRGWARKHGAVQHFLT